MQRSHLQNIRVLIVDDEKTILRLVYDVLMRLGFRDVTIAGSGRQAIELVSQFHFDFAISDWHMQDLDGIDFVRHVRGSDKPELQRMPIIMLTGNTEARHVFGARDAGVNEYLIKPFSSDQLVKRIRAIIEKPKAFVVSPVYKGPERRHKKNELEGKHDRRKRKYEDIDVE